MKCHMYSLLVLLSTAMICAELASAQLGVERPTSLEDVHNVEEVGANVALPREKRTLLLKKKILGAGIVGFGLGAGIGAIKGYNYGRGGYGGGYGSGSYGGYGPSYGYGGAFRPSYGYNKWNSYVNSNQAYNQSPYYVSRPSYEYGYNPAYNQGWNSYSGNSYNGNSYYPSNQASGSVGPLTGSLYATTSLAGSNAYNSNSGGYYY